MEREIPIRRKEVSLCRHKLQTRAYPKLTKVKKIWRSPQQTLEPENPELDHEWRQLFQMERAIERHRKQLLETKIGDHGDPNEDNEPFREDGESLAEHSDHLDDEDLEFISEILNLFSRPTYNHEGSSDLKLRSITPEDALARSCTPQKFNLKFNQNSTTRGSKEDHLSYFSNVEEEGTSELGDYFSDDEDDYTWNKNNLTSESNPWSPTDFNIPSPHTLSEWDPVISGLETINEAKFENDSEADKLSYISGFSEETKLALSTWRLFIPPEHVFQSYAAQLQPLDFLSQASSSQEPTLIQISTITTATELMPPMKQTSPQPETSLLQPKAWPSLEQTTRLFTPTWTKFQTESKKTSNSWQKGFPDHQGPSKQCRPWKQQSQCLTGRIQNQNTRPQNMPPVRDIGNRLLGCTPLKLWSSSMTKPKRSTAQIKYWGTQCCKFSSRIPICQTKSPKNIRPLQRNSRRIIQPNINTEPDWPDLQGPRQPSRQKRLPSGSYGNWRIHRSPFQQSAHWKKDSAFSQTRFKKISNSKNTEKYPGGNLSSKRRSESESHYYGQQERLNSKSESKNRNKNYRQYKTQNFESESKTKNGNMKAIKVRKEEALTKLKNKITIKVNEVKAIEKTLTGPRIKRKKQLHQRIGSKLTSTLPSHFTATINISIFIYILTIFIFKNFISISNLNISDPSDPLFQTFTVEELSDCKTFRLSQQTASIQAETLIKTLANSDSRRLFKFLKHGLTYETKNLSRNPFVPNHTPSGRARKSETNLYHDSFLCNYLDFSR
jgi:hypothetical protein